LTDLWRNLVRYHPPPRQEPQPEDDEEEEDEERDEEIAESYKNQYWTRIISLQRIEDETIERWPLDKDIIECLHEIHG
jgi:hypothetical protein